MEINVNDNNIRVELFLFGWSSVICEIILNYMFWWNVGEIKMCS